jgi:hypothetical protein
VIVQLLYIIAFGSLIFSRIINTTNKKAESNKSPYDVRIGIEALSGFIPKDMNQIIANVEKYKNLKYY